MNNKIVCGRLEIIFTDDN